MPAPIKIGDNSLREVGRKGLFDPQRGVEITVTYEGEEAAVFSEAAVIKSNGGRANPYPWAAPGIYRMEVVYPDDALEANDTWERVSEFVQDDVRANPKVIAAFGDTDGFIISVVWSEIERALEEGDAPNWANTENFLTDAGYGFNLAAAQALFRVAAYGQTSHEIRRIVLRRRRTIPIGFTTPRNPTAVELVYTTGSLVSTFEIPAGIQSILPATPGTAPSGYAWAWKVRVDSSILIPYERKTEEVMEWTFAPWSLLTYDLA